MGQIPDGVLFDLDGTLLDTATAICDAASASFASLGVAVKPEHIAPHLGAPLDELYAHFVGDGSGHREHTFVTNYIRAYDAHPEAAAAPLPGVEDGLVACARLRLPMSVATTKPTLRARSQIEDAGLDAHFVHVQGTDSPMRAKPEPDVLVTVCEAMGVEAARTVFVGDTVRDVLAARAVGAQAVVVAYSERAAVTAEQWQPDLVVRSLVELVDRLWS